MDIVGECVMIRCNQFGQHTRLGNWLFVYAFIVSVAEKTGHKVEMPEGYFLWKYLQNPPNTTTETSFDTLFSVSSPSWSQESMDNAYGFFAKHRDKTINVDLTCFLQSEKWFDPKTIKRHILISEQETNNILNGYDVFNSGRPIIGIGIRRGDFVGHNVFYQIPENWYLNTLESNFEKWDDNHHVLILSDDIEWCSTFYSKYPFFYAKPNQTHKHGATYHKDPMEQFILGANCNYFIGGSSTFSWWQMWYVKNIKGGDVFHCGKNISDQFYKKYGHADYYPENWKCNPC